MGKIEVKSKKGSKAFNGFEESYPRQLEGIVPVKEYLDAIEILNYNGIRDFTSIIVIVVGYILFGIIIVLICAIVELIRFSIFKSQLKKDLNKCLEYINSALEPRQVYITLKMNFSAMVTLEINYPNVTTNPSNELIALDGGLGNAILVHPWSNSNFIQNPRISIPKDQPSDYNYKNILVPTNVMKFSWKNKYFQGFSNFYNFKLYNYISVQEYNLMVDEYNQICMSLKYNQHCYKFFLASLILIFFLIGFLLIIPSLIWLSIENKKFNQLLTHNIDILNRKYNSIYASRGINLIYKDKNVYITIPSDVGQAPILTKFSEHCDKDQLVLAPTIPNGILPFYQVNCTSQPAFIQSQPIFEKIV